MDLKEKEQLQINFKVYVKTFLFCATSHPAFSFDVLDEVIKDVKEHVIKHQIDHGK